LRPQRREIEGQRIRLVQRKTGGRILRDDLGGQVVIDP
jgi:hypothetical protein